MPVQRAIRVLIVGQTPPPYGGQAVMIDALLSGEMRGVERRHVRLVYSKDLAEVGQFSFGKLLHLMGVVARVWKELVLFRPDVVYYPPAGPNMVPVVRDIITLMAIRPFCSSIVFHFHAAGLSEIYTTRFRSGLRRRLFRRAYFEPDAAIMLARSNPPDGQTLNAKQVFYVPYGLRDESESSRSLLSSRREGPPSLLFVGVLIETKGVLTLVRACGLLWERGYDFNLRLVGSASSDMKRRINEVAGDFSGRVRILGVRTGLDKWKEFSEADIFCYPTYFEAESFGLVCAEAMMFGLPVVASRWRGVSEVVIDGETGLLVSPEDAADLAEKVERLLLDEHLREAMGRAGRLRYEREYSMERFLRRMREVFVSVARHRYEDPEEV